jgi:hypothetical protein
MTLIIDTVRALRDHEYLKEISDQLETCMRDDVMEAAADEIEKLRAAVSGIAPWLSASLSEDPYKNCTEYVAACEAVFECDPEIKTTQETAQ